MIYVWNEIKYKDTLSMMRYSKAILLQNRRNEEAEPDTKLTPEDQELNGTIIFLLLKHVHKLFKFYKSL